MSEAFHQGGWGMFPTSLMGLVLLVVAGLYARRPEKGKLGVVLGFAAMTFLAGCLGFVAGAIKTLAATAQISDPTMSPGQLAAQGISESLQNVALALILLVLAAIVTTIGTIRASRSGGGVAVRVHSSQ